MILIFGGAYQGKRDFAKEHFGIETVTECAAPGAELAGAEDTGAEDTGAEDTGAEDTGAEGHSGAETVLTLPDFSGDAVCGLERFARACTEAGLEARDLMEEQKAGWQDKILIITDVSQGIVPMDKTTRAFREMNGRLMLYLASEADEVWRVFCGIGKRIR